MRRHAHCSLGKNQYRSRRRSNGGGFSSRGFLHFGMSYVAVSRDRFRWAPCLGLSIADCLGQHLAQLAFSLWRFTREGFCPCCHRQHMGMPQGELNLRLSRHPHSRAPRLRRRPEPPSSAARQSFHTSDQESCLRGGERIGSQKRRCSDRPRSWRQDRAICARVNVMRSFLRVYLTPSVPSAGLLNAHGTPVTALSWCISQVRL
jgi:hypothetical protein